MFLKRVDVDLYLRAVPSTLKRSTSFFADKVARVRPTTSDAPSPTFSRVRPGTSFCSFSLLTTDDVIDAIRRLQDKQSAADPIPTSVLKQIYDVIASFIVEMFNRWLSEGHFLAVFKVLFKEAFITPVMKKPGLDSADTSSYRPILNLLSKLLVRLVVRQLLMGYLSSADLPSLQSGFRQGHSTETAVLRVLSDILQAVGRVHIVTELQAMKTVFSADCHRSVWERAVFCTNCHQGSWLSRGDCGNSYL